MGIYKRLAAVPDHHRLAQYANAYAGRDVWADFAATRSRTFDSDCYRATLRKAEESWKAHIHDLGRHHALARPQDIETWCATLTTTRTLGTVYSEYWVRLEEFYGWLQTHTDHPHAYHPVLMAAAHHETARVVWDVKVGQAGKAVNGRD